MEKILSYAKELNNINESQYIKLLHDSTIDRFYTSQYKFGNAVDAWSKIFGIMLSKAPSYRERIVLLKNLNDEHGLVLAGENSQCNCTLSHIQTFEKFLSSIKQLVKNETLIGNTNEVDQFINQLHCMVEHHSWQFCVAALGMIEFTYITISQHIHKYVSNYIAPNEIEHYSLHEIIDVDHANDLFNLAVPYDDENTNNDVKLGMLYGYTIFKNLYDKMSNHLRLQTNTSE
jgi:hypothetical protein